MARSSIIGGSGTPAIHVRVLAALAALALVIVAAPVHAQDVRHDHDSITVAACAGGTITRIDYLPDPPPLAGERVPSPVRPVMRLLLQHRQTRPAALEPFLLLREGDPCSLDRLAESERLLRAQPYIADARIRATSDASGVVLQVGTVDEIPVIIGGGVRDGSISRAKFGNGNVLGYGALASLDWRQGFAYRDGIGLNLAHYHLIGRSTAELRLLRGTFEEEYAASLSRPWLTDAQHTAWHIGAMRQEGYVRYLRQDNAPLSLPIERDYFDVGALLRLGKSLQRMMGGVVASYERIDPGSSAIVIADTGFAIDSDTTLTNRFSARNQARIGAILGGRFLAYREMPGLDSLAGLQDVATGMQFALIAGHGLSRGRRDPFGALDLYLAAGGGNTLVALHTVAEARFQSASDWEDVVASGHLVYYGKPSHRRTRVIRAELSGEWDASFPRQLSLADRAGGPRGYRGSDEAGGRRLAIRLEERFSVGGIGRMVGIGVAGFTDFGKLWSGSVPFGTTTSLRPSVGVGVLFGVPRRSQRHYRLDVAVPLVREGDTRSWTLRLSSSAGYETFWREPGDVRRLRAGQPAGRLLAWR